MLDCAGRGNSWKAEAVASALNGKAKRWLAAGQYHPPDLDNPTGHYPRPFAWWPVVERVNGRGRTGGGALSLELMAMEI